MSIHVATRRSRWTLTTLLLVGLAGCGRVDQIQTVVLGSTTSLYDSGLLDELVASFEAGNPDLAVRVLAVGTGQALELGRRGDADLLLVHAPDAERLFVQDGHGRDRVTFMRNDFVIAGPSDDPARVHGLGGEGAGPRAVAAIAASGSRFLSRGDDSGTHMRERALWEQAGIGPAGDWYEEAGQGMGGTLVIAAERGAYLLTDRATLTVLGDVARLEVLASGGSELENMYSVVAVTRGANPEGAERLRRWVLGEQARQIIAGFGVEEYGRQLFTPLVQEPDSQPGPTVRGLGLNPFAEAWQLLMSRDLYVLEVVLRSLAISGSALLLATLIGMPLGVLVALSKFRLRTPVVALIYTGLAFPPVVVGLAVFLLLSRAGPLGPLELLYSPTAVVMAQVVLAGPYIAAVTLAALESVPPDVRLQARGLGASRWQALVLHLREARASLVAAVAAGFGAVISEVGAVMIVGGNLLGETRVMTTAIVLETRRGNFGVAIALGIVLLGIAFAVNMALTLLHSRALRRPALS